MPAVGYRHKQQEKDQVHARGYIMFMETVFCSFHNLKEQNSKTINSPWLKSNSLKYELWVKSITSLYFPFACIHTHTHTHRGRDRLTMCHQGRTVVSRGSDRQMTHSLLESFASTSPQLNFQSHISPEAHISSH